MKELLRIKPNGKVMAGEQCGLMNTKGKRVKTYSQESPSSTHALLSEGSSSPVGLGVGLLPIKRRVEDLRGNDIVDGVKANGQGYLSSTQEKSTTNAAYLVKEVCQPEEFGISSCDKQGAPSMSSHCHNFSNHGNGVDLAEPKFRF
uniref:Uncharacterized protein n=1 Tax=Chenopodium quinoa TaxID=63459 RepID=A0A803N5S2_CHEQI